jgi:membrane-associated protease RseP (regulator of RpoE activity)
MSSGASILAFVVALFVMIIVHETGHFLTARAFGIKVEQFFIGFGPKIFSWRRGETEYGLKAVLLGGYVRIAGMNPWETIHESERPRTFGAKPAWQRAIVLAAGSATHFVLGFVIMTLLFGVIGHPLADSTRVDAIQERVGGAPGPAVTAGLSRGDEIVSVNGAPIRKWEEFREIVRSSPGEPLRIVVERDGSRRTIEATPATTKDDEKTVGMLGVTPAPLKVSLPKAVTSGAGATGELMAQSVKGIVTIFSPRGIKTIINDLRGEGDRPLESAQGLIGIGRTAGVAGARGGLPYLLLLFAYFIIFVGVINLAPLPPLDGGHLLVLLLEKVRGRPVDMKKVVPVAAVVLTFLLLLTVALIYLDIARPVTAPF